MFYSQTFLARKGPLSTVWIAAHLQHRLKKSHYTATDIPSTVLRIMDPGVPIALRMSGHLLLGVVRIYSKKVEYLHQDCKDALTTLHKAFANLQFAQLEEARPVPFQSVTLPGTFDLDAQDIEAQIEYIGAEDRHMRSMEDITLTDQIPFTMDRYVSVSFDEDMLVDSSHTGGAVPMEEDVIPQSRLRNVVGAEDHGPITERESPIIQHIGGSGPSSPSPAIQPEPFELLRRDANNDNNQVFQHTVVLSPSVHSPSQATQVEHGRDANNGDNLENPQLFLNVEGIDAEPNVGLDQTTNEKDHVPGMMHDLDFGMSVPSLMNPLTPPTSQGGASDAQARDEINVPDFGLRASPPIQQPQRRGRKRKQFFDESIVLTNKFMRSVLNNTRDILRKRRDLPLSIIGTWKLNNSRRKEHIFDQPLLTGVGKDLFDISRSEYVRSRPHLLISEEDHADARMAETLSPTTEPSEEPITTTNQPPVESIAAPNQPPVESIAVTNQSPEEPIAATDQTFEEAIIATSPVSGMEIEHTRNVAVTPHANIQVQHDYTSPNRRDYFTMPSHNVSIASLSTNVASERIRTPDFSASPGACGSEAMQTPISDTHDMMSSDKTDEFWFLKLDSNTPASSQGTSGSNKMSERTKHAAQYFERLSSISPILEEPAGDLSLNKILTGKTRNIAARMFFEVLVLKTNEVLDVEQEEPYGDISLKLVRPVSNSQS